MKHRQMSMQEIAGFLLSDAVTEDVTETGTFAEMISVSDATTEILKKRKRGRPPVTGEAMTAAERSRRYRETHRPAGQCRRVDLWASTVERAEKLAALRCVSVAELVDSVVREDMIRIWSNTFELAQAAAAKSEESVEEMVNFALVGLRNARLKEIVDERFQQILK